MKVHVNYMVPAYAVVDTDTGEVERVAVEDEAAKPTGEVTTPEGDDVRDLLAYDTALRIAKSAEWPEWTIGAVSRP